MESRTAGRALSDAMVAVAAYGAGAIGLTILHSPGVGLQAIGLGAGAMVIGHAAASIVHRSPRFSTSADRITLLRAVLVALCAVLAVPGLFVAGPADPLVVIVGAAAFLLDAVDGPVARRTGTASVAGARFDTATDAALVLVLSCATAAAIGPWTLCIGALYYVFVASGHIRLHLRGPLPANAARKAIGAYQPFALLLALTPGMAPAVAAAAPALALLLLVFSFARDVVQLERQHHTGHPSWAKPTAVPPPALSPESTVLTPPEDCQDYGRPAASLLPGFVQGRAVRCETVPEPYGFLADHCDVVPHHHE
ncbi:CDP-alcohol phosphatidyltransferase family protein [Arthrobacter sp. ISL-28]|uniref:CDP-alcohol phosphatidyltransferase family protein n=1 Tax=Arthrobacter sp. ISL-28 TaxID=2819108 RepID=UPI001BEBA729|nr:CDP-alcohol phosphatidyltransferase family protein [Arthrobacter sp. ISL-28]MBT2522043.1 CDP-alcohol phosphatidyltransferase family protein [Arthrobacter sp. ISL-28]